ncbi:group II intron maturase-specific domain-containing protein (plasmid) [Sinorhizobium meliloti]
MCCGSRESSRRPSVPGAVAPLALPSKTSPRPCVAGWAYFRLTEVKGIREELDGWLRRRLRCILWRQWKRPATRVTRLMQRGLTEQRPCDSASNGHGPWWNAGASHMHGAFRKAFFDQFGLISLQQELRSLNHAS